MKLLPNKACETEKNLETQEIERTQSCKVTFTAAERLRTALFLCTQSLLKGLVMQT